MAQAESPADAATRKVAHYLLRDLNRAVREFGMIRAGERVEPFADDGAVPGQNGAHHRVGTRPPPGARREVQRAAHVGPIRVGRLADVLATLRHFTIFPRQG